MQKSPFQHILITRFNVRLPGVAAPNDEWLKERWALFQRWTLPSVTSQSVQPDRWLILCSTESPEWFRREMAALNGPVIETVYLSQECTPEAVQAVVRRRLDGRQHLITTRLDNDDAITREFLALVQHYFSATADKLINFVNGAQLSGRKAYRRSNPMGPFVSLVEAVKDGMPRTVFVDGHHLLARHFPNHQVNTHPAWIQLIHGSNLANHAVGIRMSPAALQAYFSMDLDLKPISGARLTMAQAKDVARLAGRVIRAPHRLVWAWMVLLTWIRRRHRLERVGC